KELQLDRENPALPDRTVHYRATLKAYTYEKEYPEWIKKLEYMNTQLKALIDIMVGVEAQAPSPRSDRFIEHFIHEEQEDLKERGNVASNTIQEQLNLSRHARPGEQHGLSLHEELLRVKLDAVEQQQKNLNKEREEFEKQKLRDKAELDKEKAKLVQLKTRNLKTEDSRTDNQNP
uniref:Uncharacterized protein n=3 Tax=Caenorhabditis japonica TaxID=281687 RepID=A0A8R1I930_CAEJA